MATSDTKTPNYVAKESLIKGLGILILTGVVMSFPFQAFYQNSKPNPREHVTLPVLILLILVGLYAFGIFILQTLLLFKRQRIVIDGDTIYFRRLHRYFMNKPATMVDVPLLAQFFGGLKDVTIPLEAITGLAFTKRYARRNPIPKFAASLVIRQDYSQQLFGENVPQGARVVVPLSRLSRSGKKVYAELEARIKAVPPRNGIATVSGPDISLEEKVFQNIEQGPNNILSLDDVKNYLAELQLRNIQDPDTIRDGMPIFNELIAALKLKNPKIGYDQLADLLEAHSMTLGRSE